MADDNVLGKELLKQDGLGPDRASDEHRLQLQRLFAEEERRVRRIRRRAKIIWLVLAVWPVAAIPISYIISWGLPPGRSVTLLGLIILGWFVLVPCAVVHGIFAYLASRTVNMRRIQQSLAGISDQLRRLSDAQKG